MSKLSLRIFINTSPLAVSDPQILKLIPNEHIVSQSNPERVSQTIWSIGGSGEVLNGLKSGGFLASGLSTYDFSTLYTALPRNLIKEKLAGLVEQAFGREGSLYLACNDKGAFFASGQPGRYRLWSCRGVCDALCCLSDGVFVGFGLGLYRQVVGVPMGTDCAPLVADLFLFCYGGDFMLSLSGSNQSDIIEALTLPPDI